MNITGLSSRLLFLTRDSLLGAQTLFIAIGATVMVPLLTGMDPCSALLTAGIGTLIFKSVIVDRFRFS